MDTLTALLIPADAETDPELREINAADTLGARQEAVGGYIEAVRLSSVSADMFVNEEGKIYGLTCNTRATNLVGMLYGEISLGDYIAGNAIITGGIDEEGNTLGLDPLQVHELKIALQHC